ncbi:MAG: hypothetical protein D6814_09185 [Calditrichaeota bacterium]|nr:MAG: hypothetical protein D6814_09185 [Calditrichota bacterium]
MVDINLLGEEEKHEPVNREEKFDQPIDLDTPDFSSEQRSYISEYPELNPGRSSARLWIIVGVLAVIAVVFIYFLVFNKGENEGDILNTLSNPEPSEMTAKEPPSSGTETPENVAPQETQTQAAAETESAPAQTDVGNPPVQEAPATPAPTPQLSPVESQILASGQLGRFAVGSIANAISNTAIVTLIRYSDQTFMVEFVAAADEEMARAISQLRGALAQADLKIVHQENYPLHGPTAVKALVTGSIDASALSAGMGGGIRYFSINEFLNWARNTAKANGLSIKTLNQSTGFRDQGYAITPIQLSLDGSMQATMDFLDAFSSASPNLKVDKISLINKDPRGNTADAMSLVMVLHHYSR